MRVPTAGKALMLNLNNSLWTYDFVVLAKLTDEIVVQIFFNELSCKFRRNFCCLSVNIIIFFFLRYCVMFMLFSGTVDFDLLLLYINIYYYT